MVNTDIEIILPFTQRDIANQFEDKLVHRGKDYQQHGLVSELNIEKEGHRISARVVGRRSNSYRVFIDVQQAPAGEISFTGQCTCYLGHNCKHVVSCLFDALDRVVEHNHRYHQSKEEELGVGSKGSKAPWQDWIQTLSRRLAPVKKPVAETQLQHPDSLVFVLSLREYPSKCFLSVEILLARKLVRGGYGKPKRVSEGSMPMRRAMVPADEAILDRIFLEKRKYHVNRSLNDVSIEGESGCELFKAMLATGRCFWNTIESEPLLLGNTRKTKFTWMMTDEGAQKLTCHLRSDSVLVLPINPPWYLDKATRECGLVDSGFTGDIASLLLKAPVLPPEEAKAVQGILQKQQSMLPHSAEIPVPKSFSNKEKKDYDFKPKIHLFGADNDEEQSSFRSRRVQSVPLARISFGYSSIEVDLSSKQREVKFLENEEMVTINRDIKKEGVALDFALAMGLQSIIGTPVESKVSAHCRYDYLVGRVGDSESQLRFLIDKLPKFQQAGWQVDIDESFPVQCIAADEKWYSKIDDEMIESSGINWFDLELGVEVDGEQINVLPLLVDLIEDFGERLSISSLESLGPDYKFKVKLPGGKFLALSADRMKGILAVLTELYDRGNLSKRGTLRLSSVHIGQLNLLQGALGKDRIAWEGADKFLQIGERLTNFKGIEAINPSAAFKGTLREYQKEGLSWLNFIREYSLGGILADDMGLGKTVQALSLLQLEKESNRLKNPCLIVAPTSLMINWKLEAKKFAPNLKVLVLQGSGRKKFFDKIDSYDIVLTTYPLLARDHDILVEKTFHYIILDEAQYIKNPNAKGTQVLHQLKSKHRLCITGTPLENNLGELWSLFNFVLPGLLGDSKQFKKLYQVPIEKHEDEKRTQSLVSRVGPFMLRRTKDEVLKELPPKTEIIQTITLDGAQRDLYESIRLSMEKKIKEAIKSKGLGGSHLEILDALLKLRQVCNDPRLLKMEVPHNVLESAKLEALREMIPEMIKEGRRILLFSTFTSMLDLIEAEVNKLKIPYAKLTGQTKNRQVQIDAFQNEEKPLFLISLKAGGTGLNLTAADTVIHVDPWWNPAAENQATDRAYRIGQVKKVFVYKMITQGTVEEKILGMQKRKQALLDDVLKHGTEKTFKMTQEDLVQLLRPIEA